MRRQRSIAPCLLAAVLVLTPTLAQTSERGDHEYRVGVSVAGERGSWQPAEGQGDYAHLDLLDAGIVAEDGANIIFGFTTAEPPFEHSFESEWDKQIRIEWTWAGATYAVRFDTYTAPPQQEVRGWSAWLTRPAPPSDVDVARLQIEARADGLAAFVPRSLLAEASATVPLRGMEFTDIVASSHGTLDGVGARCGNSEAGWCGVEVRDFFPNSGFLAAYVVQQQPEADGHLIVTSSNSVRASNGAATTYLFDLHVANLAIFDDSAVLQLGQLPSGWHVSLPDEIPLKPESQVRVPVAVQIPFAHQHGERLGFDVTVASQADSSVQLVQRYEVQWIEPPQPGGHHPRLFVHSTDDRGLFLDTISQPQGPPVELLTTTQAQDGTIRWERTAELYPALWVGIDAADEARPMQLALSSSIEADLSARVEVWVQNDTRAPDAQPQLLFWAEQPVNLGSGKNQFDLKLQATPMADYFPIVAPATMEVRLSLEGAIQNHGPGIPSEHTLALLPEDTWLELGLQDFHERVHLDAAVDYGIELGADSLDALANPGDVVLFTLSASSEVPRRVDLSLEGPHAEMARVLSSTLDVADAASDVPLRVDIPDDAEPGQRFDIVVRLTDTEDASVQAALFLRVDVVAEELPSAEEEADAVFGNGLRERESPSLAPLVMLAAIYVFFGRRT